MFIFDVTHRQSFYIVECAWFTYYPGGKFCQLFKNCEVLNAESCDGNSLI